MSEQYKGWLRESVAKAVDEMEQCIAADKLSRAALCAGRADAFRRALSDYEKAVVMAPAPPAPASSANTKVYVIGCAHGGWVSEFEAGPTEYLAMARLFRAEMKAAEVAGPGDRVVRYDLATNTLEESGE